MQASGYFMSLSDLVPENLLIEIPIINDFPFGHYIDFIKLSVKVGYISCELHFDIMKGM